MITFTLCLLALIAGYFLYGRFIEHIFGPSDSNGALLHTGAKCHVGGCTFSSKAGYESA